MDIDDFKDFKQFVANLIAHSAKKVLVFVDMADLHNSWKAVSRNTIFSMLHTDRNFSVVREVVMMKTALRTRMR